MTPKPELCMPLHWGHLLADTLHLTRGEFGAYLLLIGAYWCRRGPLPDDDTILRNVARYEPGEWTSARPIFAAFFTVKNGTWTHKRIEAELADIRDTQAKQRQRTAAATAARRNVTTIVTTNVTLRGKPPVPTVTTDVTLAQPVRKPANLDECLVMAQRIGMAEPDARDWYRDCEAAGWRRGDGTLFDNWPRQMSLHRDLLREKRARTPNGAASLSPAAESILRQTELKRVEERMRVIKSSYESHSIWDDAHKKEFNTLRDRKKQLVKILGMTV